MYKKINFIFIPYIRRTSLKLYPVLVPMFAMYTSIHTYSKEVGMYIPPPGNWQKRDIFFPGELRVRWQKLEDPDEIKVTSSYKGSNSLRVTGLLVFISLVSFCVMTTVVSAAMDNLSKLTWLI